MKETVGR